MPHYYLITNVIYLLVYMPTNCIYICSQVRVGDECVYLLKLMCANSLCGLAVARMETLSSDFVGCVHV